MSTELTAKTAAELAGLVAGGEASAVEVAQAHLDRIVAVDGDVHAFLHVDIEGALEAARAVDVRRAAGETLGPLAGVPLAMKDVVVTKDLPTTAGSKILEGWRPPYDATITSRIKDAGIVMLGKTNMDEFAMGSSTENSAYGPTHNPWDLTRIPGGSSGGSSAAVAAFEAPLSIGTDTGGSIRQPAAVTGIVGHKPTYGGVSRYGLIAFSSSLDQAGPFGRTVLDAALLHEVIGGHDPCDSTSIAAPVPPVVAAARAGANGDLSGVRVGIVRELGGEGYQQGVLDSFAAAVDTLRGLGAEVVEVSCPSFDYALAAYYLIAPSECSSNLARFDAVRYGMRVGDDGSRSLEEVMSLTRDAGFGPEVKRRIMLGTYALSSGLLRGLLRPGAEGPHADRPGLRRRVREGGRADLAEHAGHRVRYRRGRRPADDVPQRPVHAARLARRHAGHLGTQRAVRGVAGGTADHGPGARRRPVLPRGGGVRVGGDAGARLDPAPGGVRCGCVMNYDEVIANFEPVIGLETHVELGTVSKMFCGCSTEFGAEPNTHTCPVCLGLPGALPVANEVAIESTIRIGLALNCSIASWCRFARKNYFYPDMPKNFQTSQYDEPLCVDGYLDVDVDGTTYRVEIERVHLEEDTGKNTHVGTSGRIHGADYSLVDYNRAGIPLVEIVTKPVPGTGAKAPEVAKAYVTELRDILRTLGVSDVRMEQGSLRCDVNTSLNRPGEPWGTRTETKNVNSLRSVERAVRSEMLRQADVLTAGGRIVQETRHFQEQTGDTRSGRSKEEATDYRYFPEPDLVPMAPDPEWVERLKGGLPELPAARRARLRDELGLSDEDLAKMTNAGVVALVAATVDAGAPVGEARNWWMGYLAQKANERDTEAADLGITPAQVARVIELVASGSLTTALARQAVDGVLDTGSDVDTVVADKGLQVVSDTGALEQAADDAIAANPDVAEKVRGGKLPAVGALVGAVMKATRGQADAAAVKEILLQRLGVG